MKREAFGHTKLKRLCLRLDLRLWQGVGLLETLWQLTAREAPCGDIGRLSDDDIAIGLDWTGDIGPAIEALLKYGWLEVHEKYRLVVHDWWEHSDHAVHNKVARRKELFWCTRPPKLSNLPRRERESLELFYGVEPETRCTNPPNEVHKPPKRGAQTPHLSTLLPSSNIVHKPPKRGAQNPQTVCKPEPEPEPEPEPSSAVVTVETVHTHTNSAARARTRFTTNGTAPAPTFKRLDEFLARYPDKSDADATARAYIAYLTPETEYACAACLSRYLASDRVARNVVQRGRNWIEQQSRNGFTGQWEPHRASGRRVVGKPVQSCKFCRQAGEHLADCPTLATGA